MAAQPIIEVKELVKSFEGKRVIDGVTFSLFSGENLVLLGKSGTGKSVIMKCIVRLMEQDEGTIEVFGQDLDRCRESELDALRSRIGYLFQEGALYDSMSIRENLLFPALRHSTLRKLPSDKLEALVRQNLENVGLLEAIEKMPSELSGGMRKRAGLARSLMLSPELIIYDEPTTGLDPFTSRTINELIMKIRETYNTSSIIITHDINCARTTGDRLLVLHQGRIIAGGSFEELREHNDPEVQLFFNP
jgi:phospholipid/cholesterol/gamma-HCH transport system ATP-binding protein